MINDLINCFKSFIPFTSNIIILCLLITIDTISGILSAKKHQHLCLLKFFKFIPKILFFLMVIFSIHICEWVMFVDSTSFLTSTSIIYFCVTELKSILENFYKLGVPIPPAIKSALKSFKERSTSFLKSNFTKKIK